MKRTHVTRSFLVAVSLVLVACSGSVTPAPATPTSAPEPTAIPEPATEVEPTKTAEPTQTLEPTATEAPTPSETPMSTVTSEPSITPMPTPDIILPSSVVKAVEMRKDRQKLGEGLASDHTIIYALPNVSDEYKLNGLTAKPGIAYLLTPRRQAPWNGEPSSKLEELGNQGLGVLHVVQQLIPELPADTYLIDVDPKSSGIRFVGEEEKNIATFTGTINLLPISIAKGRPVALITSRRMCFTWDATQICANVSTQLPLQLKELLQKTADSVGVKPTWIDPDGAVPDVEGLEVLKDCQDALSKDRPDYEKCIASVLAAPITVENEVPTPVLTTFKNTEGKTLKAATQAYRIANTMHRQHQPVGTDIKSITATTVLTVLDDIQDFICQDITCNPPVTDVGVITTGTYVMYDIVLEGDPLLSETASLSRVGLSRSVVVSPELYLPAVIGMETISPSGADEEVISNLWMCKKNGKCSCYFKWLQCWWLE